MFLKQDISIPDLLLIIALDTLPLEVHSMRTGLRLLMLCIILFSTSAFASWESVNPGLPETGAVRVVSEAPSTVTINFAFAGYETEPVDVNGAQYSRITVPDMAPLLETGHPELPIWAKSVIVPDRGRISVRVISEEWEEVSTPPVLPSKGNLPRTINPADVPYQFTDVYRRDSWYPAETVALSDPFIIRDFRGITILIHPLQYNGAQGKLRVCKEITVEVFVDTGTGIHEKIRPRIALSREFLPLYENLFVNFIRDAHPISETAGRMLIISADQFYDDMDDFVTWKQEKGIEVSHVRYSEIGGTGSTAVKNYIQSEYDGPGVTFVLLVGDKEHIPTLSYAGGEADPMYTLLEDGDVYPDTYISRFSVQSSGDVQTMVERSIGYEKNPTVATDWYHEATGIASAQGSPPDYQWMNGFRDKLLAWNYTAMDQIYDPSATAAQVTTALNDGRSLVLYMGHGSTSSWGTTGFSTSNVNALTNDWMLPVISSVACVNGDFSATTCFAEAWLRATNAGNPSGAIAFYGSSINQSWVPPQYGQQGFVDTLVSERYNTVGGTLFMGSVAMLEHYGGGSDATEIFNTWHIFGDCSVQLRTNVPGIMVANYPASVPVGSASVQVSVPGIPDALVAFSQAGELLGAGYTDASGDVTVTFVEPLPAPGTMLMTITAYNYEPVIDDVLIIAPNGPYVIYSDNTILGDGSADVGDNVSMSVTLENVGTETAYDVQGTLGTSDPAITLGTTVQDFGDITADNSADSPGPYTYTVGAVGDLTGIPFTMTVTSGDSTWIYDLNILIHAPVLAQVGWSIDDASGNGNGRPDPGETVGLSIAVANSGSGVAGGAQLTLDDSDPYVSITGSTTTDLGDIPAGGQVVSPSYTLMFDAGCPEAYPAEIGLSFSSNGGVYTADGTLTLVVGQRELLYVDSDNEDTETRITEALDLWGGSYTRWNTYETGNSVIPLDTLRAYRMVLWASGDQNNSSIIAENQTNLATWLDEGGALLFSGENYLSTYGSSSFTSDYLHVSDYTTSISGTQVIGEAGDPIGDGISATLSYPSGLAEYPDEIQPDAEAAVVFRMQSTDDPVAIRYPSTGMAAYKVVFFAVPLEAFPAASRNTIDVVVENCLEWLGGGGDLSAPTMPMDLSLSFDGTLTWSASTDNIGVDHYCIYRDTSAHFSIIGRTPIQTATGTSASFPGSMGDPLTNYFFRVTAKDAAGNESQASNCTGEFDYTVGD